MANAGGYAYISPEVNLNVTSANVGYVLKRAVGVFYKTSNNIWRLKGNINADMNDTALAIAIVGIVFKNVSGFAQAVTATFATNRYGIAVYADPGTTNIYATASGATAGLRLSFDVELDSKPTAYLPDGV
jgi:hypothetical protein